MAENAKSVTATAKIFCYLSTNSSPHLCKSTSMGSSFLPGSLIPYTSIQVLMLGYATFQFPEAFSTFTKCIDNRN